MMLLKEVASDCASVPASAPDKHFWAYCDLRLHVGLQIFTVLSGFNVGSTGCRFSRKTSCILILILQSAKVPKYHQSIKIRRRALKHQNIGCIDADFCADFAFFLHFSRSTRICCRKRVKFSKSAKILRTKFGNFHKMNFKKVIF